MTTSIKPSVRLWSDEPSAVDLFAFAAVADTAVEAVLDDALDPLAIGVSGPWGSGKTTILRLIEAALQAREMDPSRPIVLIVATDPWRYDPSVGAKESLISEVLARIGKELKTHETVGNKALEQLKKLAKRVDWAKGLRLAARTSLTLQLPSVEDLSELIRSDAEGEEETRGLEAFRDEFANLMASDELAHVKRVVVLVDDLDRCLPETVIDTLETIRLFLAVPKMSFVIAADEERVADAIRTRYPGSVAEGEEPAKLYLHKIVQTTIPLPALSRFDTEAYLLLLQLMNRLEKEQYQGFVQQCAEIRLRSGDLDDLASVDGIDIIEELAFAARLTPLLYEKLRGNPRRIKRFLNDLHIRQDIAERRGITLEPQVIAKLMVLELLLPAEFATVLEWLAHGELREKIDRLEQAAGRVSEGAGGETSVASAKGNGKKDTSQPSASKSDDDFSEELLRWAKLPPDLRAMDISPYLHLAAAFAGQPLLDRDLPERLRDLAANLLSSVRAEQKSVHNSDLEGLPSGDALALLEHLARMGRDRPGDQRKAVEGVLRIARLHPNLAERAQAALSAIPSDEVAPSTVILFKMPDDAAFRPLLERWHAETTKQHTKNAVREALSQAKAR